MKCVSDLIDFELHLIFMGNFTNVFKREMFLNNINCLDVEKLKIISAQISIIVVVILKSMQMFFKDSKVFYAGWLFCKLLW